MSLPVSRYVTDDMNIVPAENVQSISQAQRSVRVLSVNEIGLNILN